MNDLFFEATRTSYIHIKEKKTYHYFSIKNMKHKNLRKLLRYYQTKS